MRPGLHDRAKSSQLWQLTFVARRVGMIKERMAAENAASQEPAGSCNHLPRNDK